MWGFRDGARLGEDARDELLALQVGLQALFVWVDRDRDWRLDPQERRALLDARRGPSATPPPRDPHAPAGAIPRWPFYSPGVVRGPGNCKPKLAAHP